MLEFVRHLKRDEGPKLRIVGSPSIMRQLLEARVLDVLRVMVCPLVLPKTGVERFFGELQDAAFALSSQ